MAALTIETAAVFRPLLAPARYKGAYGGRGSGKSHFFAELLIETCLMRPGTRALCVREVQRSLRESAKRLLEDKIQGLGLGSRFVPTTERIDAPGGGVIAFQGMQDHNAESIKSFEGFDLCWVEEAQTLSTQSLRLLRPTIRKDDSELWFSWNPRRKSDPVDGLLRAAAPPPKSVVVRANWSDNPWFPATLDDERRYDLEHAPALYDHVWEGGYATITEGAYYAQALAQCRLDERITHVAADPLLPLYAYWDIGGSGMSADATAIWIAQRVGPQIRVIDYYEAQGQPLSAHVAWLRKYSPICVLPHDADHHGPVTAFTFAEHIRAAGFEAITVANQGKGAAMIRVEAGRRLFPSIWFDIKCQPGVEALGAYHERVDRNREIGLGPQHNWASHGADAFGLMAVHMLTDRPAERMGPIKMQARGHA